MAPTIKDSGATRMAGAHMFQAVQHLELDTLGLVAIRDFLKKRARYLRLVAQNNKADGVNVTCSAARTNVVLRIVMSTITLV
jgi:hypothetical protein